MGVAGVPIGVEIHGITAVDPTVLMSALARIATRFNLGRIIGHCLEATDTA